MPQHLNLALEHIARARRARDREALPLGGNEAFQGEEKSICHTESDGLAPPMFTGFADIARQTIVRAGRATRESQVPGNESQVFRGAHVLAFSSRTRAHDSPGIWGVAAACLAPGSRRLDAAYCGGSP